MQKDSVALPCVRKKVCLAAQSWLWTNWTIALKRAFWSVLVVSFTSQGTDLLVCSQTTGTVHPGQLVWSIRDNWYGPSGTTGTVHPGALFKNSCPSLIGERKETSQGSEKCLPHPTECNKSLNQLKHSETVLRVSCLCVPSLYLSLCQSVVLFAELRF